MFAWKSFRPGESLENKRRNDLRFDLIVALFVKEITKKMLGAIE